MADGEEKFFQNIVLWGTVIVGGYFFVVKPLLGSLGVDPAVQAIIDAESALPAPQNPFNFQFQPFVDFYSENQPDSVTVTGGSFWDAFGAYINLSPQAQTISQPTIQQFFVALKKNPPTTSPWASLDIFALAQIAEQINSAVNGFTLTATDQTAAVSPFAYFTNQMQVAFVANYFWWNFNKDLLTDLNGSLFKTGLSPANLATVITHVNSLPVNPF